LFIGTYYIEFNVDEEQSKGGVVKQIRVKGCIIKDHIIMGWLLRVILLRFS
jgi:hypothetical protein